MTESLWWQIPISTHSLRCKLHTTILAIHKLTKPEIKDLNYPMIKYYVRRFQIIMYNLCIELIQIIQRTEYLVDYFLGILFFNPTFLFQIEGKLRPCAVIHNENYFTFAHLQDLSDLGDVWVFEIFVGFYLSLDVFEEIGGFETILFQIYVIYFYGHVTILLEIVAFVNLAESTFAYQHQRQVLLNIVTIMNRPPMLLLVVAVELLEASLESFPVYFGFFLFNFQLILFSHDLFLYESNRKFNPVFLVLILCFLQLILQFFTFQFLLLNRFIQLHKIFPLHKLHIFAKIPQFHIYPPSSGSDHLRILSQCMYQQLFRFVLIIFILHVQDAVFVLEGFFLCSHFFNLIIFANELLFELINFRFFRIENQFIRSRIRTYTKIMSNFILFLEVRLRNIFLGHFLILLLGELLLLGFYNEENGYFFVRIILVSYQCSLTCSEVYFLYESQRNPKYQHYKK